MLKVNVSSAWTLVDTFAPTDLPGPYSSERPTMISKTERSLSEAPTMVPIRGRRSRAVTLPAPCDGTDLESCKMYAAVAVRGGLTDYIGHVQQ
jgi:hypothetical protein